MSDTPIVDKFCWREGATKFSEVVFAALARELERENAKLRVLLTDARDHIEGFDNAGEDSRGMTAFERNFVREATAALERNKTD